MVVVKDLSRLGRDYIYTGYYTEMWFPKRGVRFVSILDNIDTLSNDNSNFDFAPFKSLINDMYSKDNSKKIKTALRTKQLQGKWVGGCTPFGYMQDPTNKNHLIENNRESVIVKKIYSLFLSGYSINKISKYLFDKKISTPNTFRNINKKNNNSYWSSTTIKTILTNQLYTGDMVQNRRSKVNYKIKNIKRNKKEEWIVVSNTHKAIINKDDFLDVQRILKLNSNTKSNKKNEYLLNGLLYCGECKKRLVIQKSGKYFYTMCNTYRKYSKLKKCTSHSYNYDKLEKIIFNSFNYFISNINKELYEDKINEKIKNIDDKKINDKINILKNNIDTIYLDKINNKISNQMYDRLTNKIKNEIEKLENQKIKLNSIDRYKFVKNYFDKIDRKILLRLIKKVELHSDKTIDIYFNFSKPNFIANK